MGLSPLQLQYIKMSHSHAAAILGEEEEELECRVCRGPAKQDFQTWMNNLH
jgi:hypothetical protein